MGTILKVAADKGTKKVMYIRAQAQCVSMDERESSETQRRNSFSFLLVA